MNDFQYKLKPTPQLIENKTAEELIDKGYRVVSRRWCLASRCTPGWQDVLKSAYPNMVPDADFFRRGFSEDVVEVPWEVSKKMKKIENELLGILPADDAL